MKIFIAILFIAFVLVACRESDRADRDLEQVEGSGSDAYNYNHVILKNGLECIRMRGGYHGALTCNWEKWNGSQRAKNN